MKHGQIINSMKDACPNCRVGIMPVGNMASLSWVGRLGTHRELVLRDRLVIGSVELENALEAAKLEMNGE